MGWYWSRGVDYYRSTPLETFQELEQASPVEPSATEAVLENSEPV
jgi:hypothetical protein